MSSPVAAAVAAPEPQQPPSRLTQSSDVSRGSAGQRGAKQKPVVKRGSEGRPVSCAQVLSFYLSYNFIHPSLFDPAQIKCTANYLQLKISEDKGIFHYEVSFEPQIDSRNERFRLEVQNGWECSHVTAFLSLFPQMSPPTPRDDRQMQDLRWCETLPPVQTP